MLPRPADDVLEADALVDLYAAVARMAVKDLACLDPKHRATARVFLERAGLLERVQAHYGIETSDEQLVLPF